MVIRPLLFIVLCFKALIYNTVYCPHFCIVPIFIIAKFKLFYFIVLRKYWKKIGTRWSFLDANIRPRFAGIQMTASNRLFFCTATVITNVRHKHSICRWAPFLWVKRRIFDSPNTIFVLIVASKWGIEANAFGRQAGRKICLIVVFNEKRHCCFCGDRYLLVSAKKIIFICYLIVFAKDLCCWLLLFSLETVLFKLALFERFRVYILLA